MSVVTKKLLAEQVRRLLSAGDPSAASRVTEAEIKMACVQVINRLLKTEHFSMTLPDGQTIPEGVMLATYDNVVVTSYKGVSKATLPAIPINLPRNMGVFHVSRTQATPQLNPPNLTATAGGATSINLSWTTSIYATSYTIQRATNSTFTTGLATIYTGNSSSFNDSGLTTATTYYYRIFQSGPGYTDSSYGTANATTS